MNFDRLAPFYGLMERLGAGGKMRLCRNGFLGQVSGPGRILLVGEGNGCFLRECLERFPEATVTVLDSSQIMLGIAKEGVPAEHLDRVVFVHGDAREWRAGQSYDLVVTNFFLDLFSEQSLEGVVSNLAAGSHAGTVWLVADFSAGERGLAEFRRRAILWMLYRFFRITCRVEARMLTDPGPLLERAGFRCVSRRKSDWGLFTSERWQFGG